MKIEYIVVGAALAYFLFGKKKTLSPSGPVVEDDGGTPGGQSSSSIAMSKLSPADQEKFAKVLSSTVAYTNTPDGNLRQLDRVSISYDFNPGANDIVWVYYQTYGTTRAANILVPLSRIEDAGDRLYLLLSSSQLTEIEEAYKLPGDTW